jgi:hypothetical protein
MRANVALRTPEALNRLVPSLPESSRELAF